MGQSPTGENSIHLQGCFALSTQISRKKLLYAIADRNFSTYPSTNPNGATAPLYRELNPILKQYKIWVRPCIDWKATIAYTAKPETHIEGPFRFGDMSLIETTGAGKRTDAHNLRDAVIAGKSLKEIIMDDSLCHGYARFRNFYKDVKREFSDPPKRPDLVVHLYIGKPGTGKTTWADKVYPNAFLKDQSHWWGLYKGQREVIWDEFTGNCCSPQEFNLVCGKLSHQVEYKGDHIPLEADKFIIISNFVPNMWWNLSKVLVDMNSIYRRFDKVMWFKHQHQPPLEYNCYTEFELAYNQSNGVIM